MQYSVKRLLEVYEICVTDRAGVVAFFYDDSTIEDSFYCAPIWSKTCLFFCLQFLSLGLESVAGNAEHDLARMTE